MNNEITYVIEKIQFNKEIKKSLLQKLPAMNSKSVLVVGDVGLDEYIIGSVKRISPEAPVPVMDVETEEKRLGLSANVAQNIVSLGGKVGVLSVVGNDFGADLLKKLFLENGISWEHMMTDPQRPTTRKTRVMAGPHHIVRIDYELKKYLSNEIEKKFLAKYKDILSSYDAVILQDYAKGIFSEGLVQSLITMAHAQNKRVFVDPHRSNSLSFYKYCDFFKPNFDESLILSGLDFDELRENPNKVYIVGRTLQKKLQTQQVVLTRGKDGMTIFDGEKIVEVPTYAKKVFDVTGAGDTVIAALALSQVAGFSLIESCILSNLAAGNVVAKIGCVPCDLEEIKEEMSAHLVS
ncbi:MAG: D-glycero-beta-D-manno-heptose-7-phosphate kinase [Bdellovibrionaceae bacterium]|nr:D-glycero-beta-D-manno-heptose-7-phosphate kinase [Pseudobdellovibrionaceae bacterium]NUM57484.1 D-glycero-beta-D-manno-heptose-7-phosphate kinase [Pseudobdellovibrionaceae bacterium]